MSSSPTTSTTTFALRGFALGSTLWIGSAMATTSLVFIPALLRPLRTPHPTTATPALPPSDGRLTPGAPFPSTTAAPSPSAARLAAQQFSRMDALAFRAQVPLELFTTLVLATLAYGGGIGRSSQGSRSARWAWAGAAAGIAAVFPLTGATMAPLARKISRVAGDAEELEPYEDAPLEVDPEAVRANVCAFVERWTVLNTLRAGLVLGAGALGVRAWVLEG